MTATKRRVRSGCIAALAAASMTFPGPGLAAQSDTTSVQRRVRVRITYATFEATDTAAARESPPSSRTTGRLLGRTPTALLIETEEGRDPLEIAIERVSKIEIGTRKGHAGAGAGVGVFLGAIAGGWIAGSSGEDCPPPGWFGDLCGLEKGFQTIGGGLLGGFFGAVVGGIVGSQIKTDRWEEADTSRLGPAVRVRAAPGAGRRWLIAFDVRF